MIKGDDLAAPIKTVFNDDTVDEAMMQLKVIAH